MPCPPTPLPRLPSCPPLPPPVVCLHPCRCRYPLAARTTPGPRYYSTITITTVGSGDLSPSSQAGRTFAIFFIPLGVITVTNTLGVLAHARMLETAELSERTPKQLLQEVELLLIHSLGEVNESAYVMHRVGKMKLVDARTVEFLQQQFALLDADGSGELDQADVEVLRGALPMAPAVSVLS